MNLEHLALATQELSTLLSEGLIEPTTSPWACEAFYVNKHAEQVRGKFRLVINYQNLNHFLADDKFPLPNKSALFQHLSNAKVFSKFDLKAGFWQLGIHPEERYKIAFCIPDHHYQWTVMPFGLKNALSQFQKAMVRLLQPLLSNALIHVDDILLFSKDEESHAKLLAEFYNLVKSQGIMLSEKKMVVGQSSIDFLGVNISDGKYILQPHIASSLGEFPNKLINAKQIQQFLGIVNYMLDFIPKVSRYKNCLAQLLKKSPPECNSAHIETVQQLKRLSEKLPPLQIPRLGKRILQTNANWAAALSEEIDDKRNIWGYKVVHSSPQNFITILLSKKFLQ